MSKGEKDTWAPLVPVVMMILFVVFMLGVEYLDSFIKEKDQGISNPDLPKIQTSTGVVDVLPGSSLERLNSLEVVTPYVGSYKYERSLFGSFQDTDKDGCAADDQAVKRYANAEYASDCREVAAQMIDPYSGETLSWGRLRTDIVEIDHVVALKNAWTTGAWRWTRDKRVEFANDQLNLIPVSASLNSAKGSKDASEWLPPLRPFQCTYVSTQVDIKAKYGLGVTLQEKALMESVLVGCPSNNGDVVEPKE